VEELGRPLVLAAPAASAHRLGKVVVDDLVDGLAGAGAAELWDGATRELTRCAGELDPGWTVAGAGDLLWALTSIRTWEDLVIDSGWSRDWYVQSLITAARKTLLA
jgi:hypothetical protein